MGKGQPAPSVAELLGPYLAEQCSVLLALDADLQPLLDDDRDPPVSADRIHDGRVACRRLRSCLRVFQDFFSVPAARRLIDDAGWFAGRLGAVRDLDVLADRLLAAVDRLDDDLVLHDARQELTGQIGYRRRIALSGLRDALHSETYADLLDQLRRWQQQPAFAAEADKPATKLRKSLKRSEHKLSRRLRSAAIAVASADAEADALIHTARRAGKRHRYAIEAAAPVIGPAATRLLELHQEFQDSLGDYQDSRLASVLLRDLGGIPGRNGFTFGVLYAQESAHRRRLGKQLAKRARGF